MPPKKNLEHPEIPEHPDFPGKEDHEAVYDVSKAALKYALEKSELLYDLAQPGIQCKSPADAFFGLIHVHFACFDDPEITVDKLIKNAKKSVAGDAQSQNAWSFLQKVFTTFEEAGQSVTTSKTFAMIQSRKFLSKTTISSTAEIDAMVRKERQKRMMKEYDYAEGIPFVALLLVAECFGRERIAFVDEVSRPNIGGGGRVDKAKFNLLSMALVHRTWTRPAQAVLRRRVFLKSWMGSRRFLRNPHCGPWVRELIIDPPWSEVDHDKAGATASNPGGPAFLRPSLKTPWPFILSLLSCMPDLRLLSISLLALVNAVNLSMLSLDPARPLGEALGKLKALEGLMIRSLALHDVAPNRLFYTEICRNIGKLKHLRRLALQGYQNMDIMPQFGQAAVVPAPLQPVDFGDATPPPLQRLVVHFSDEPLIQNAANQLWLFRCNETLEHLFINFTVSDEDDIRERFIRRMLRIFTPNLAFPKLRRLRLTYIDDYTEPMFKGTFAKLVLAFVKNCTSLTHLHLTYSASPKVELPASLESLTLSYDWDLSLGSDSERFQKWGLKALKLVQTQELPRLKKIVIEMHCRGAFAGDPKGQKVLQMVFMGIRKWASIKQISVTIVDETNNGPTFDGRVNDFVFGEMD